MENIRKKLRISIWDIVSLNVDYGKLMESSALSDEHGWHRRINDIVFTEAPTTLTKLVLDLHLYEVINFKTDYNDNVVLLSVLRSFDDTPHLWDKALETFYETGKVKFYIDQLASNVSEIHRSLINLKGE